MTGAAKVVGTERELIVREVMRLLDDKTEYEMMAKAVNPFGDGRAAERIVGYLLGDNVSEFTTGDIGCDAAFIASLESA